MILSNLHTHTVYCDGINTPAEMAAEAAKLGFKSLGFSGHAYTPFDNGFCMSIENTEKYISEISELKKEYEGQMSIFTGLEYDLYSEYDTSLCDYVIGSVHYIKKDGAYLPADESAQKTEAVINEYFGGSGIAYAAAYFKEAARLRDLDCDIVGHFDLVSKFCEQSSLFDTESEKYKSAALDALHIAAEKKKIFELNTGAMARGFRRAPYPADFLIKEIHELGCEIIITSDCHDSRKLTYAFPEAAALLKACGFDHALALTEKGFEEYGI
ncbi:MAG: histidinol-phosphatase [Clostridia bacterium]|nr:histidinol-phosphatase [Clostridia bacterium]